MPASNTHKFKKKFTNEWIECQILGSSKRKEFEFFTVATKYGILRCVTDLIKL